MSAAAATERVPFESAPPYRLESWLGLIRAGHPQVVHRAILAVAIAWLPPAVLTLVSGHFMRPDHANAFILDFGVLCALPHRPPFLAYALVASVLLSKPDAAMPLWHGVIWGERIAPTPAGWWGLLLSLPLLFLLLLGWLWRVALWARFLWLMNRIELKLVPSHPDGARGLGFLTTSLEAFVPVAFAFGVLGAGPVLNLVVHRGATPGQFRYQALGVAVFAVVLFATPLLVFERRLINEHQRGVLSYGAFTLRAGQQFEREWLAARQVIDQQTLQAREFAATHSLYSIAGKAIEMRRVPFTLRSVGVLGGAALLPFAPVALLTVPFDVALQKVGGFFL